MCVCVCVDAEWHQWQCASQQVSSETCKSTCCWATQRHYVETGNEAAAAKWVEKTGKTVELLRCTPTSHWTPVYWCVIHCSGCGTMLIHVYCLLGSVMDPISVHLVFVASRAVYKKSLANCSFNTVVWQHRVCREGRHIFYNFTMETVDNMYISRVNLRSSLSRTVWTFLKEVAWYLYPK